jgi:hypothetical protein
MNLELAPPVPPLYVRQELYIAFTNDFQRAHYNPTTMNTSIIAAIALALNGAAITHAQTAEPSKPASSESKLPADVEPKPVTPAEFKKEYAQVGMAQTMHNVTYLGQRKGRAYINHSSKSVVSGKWSDRVIYVELAELDATFRDSLPKTKMNDPK